MSAEGQAAPWVLRRWQAEALPVVMEAVRSGKAPVVSAFMGSGKSVLVAELVRRAAVHAAARADGGRGVGVVVAAPRAGLVRQLAETIRRGCAGVVGAGWSGAVGTWYEGAKEGGCGVVVTTYQSLGTLTEEWRRTGRRAALLVCDEAHATEAAGVREAIRGLEALGSDGGRERRLYRVGVTATPYRSSSGERLSLWDEIVYRYGWRQGLADGVIVPWRQVCWEGDGEVTDATQVDAICVEMLRRHGVYPALSSSDSIADAQAFAGLLCAAGIPAAAVHSEMPRREQDARIAAVRRGDLRVIVHVSMLAEGADFPWLRSLLLRRQVRARVRFVQEVGRVLRADEGKTEGVILDPFDLLGTLGLSHADALGAALDGGGEGGDGGAEEEVEGDVEEGEGGKRGASVVRRAVKRRPVGGWLTEVCGLLEEHGLTGLPASRAMPATQRQVEVIGRMIGFVRWLPHERARERLREWVKSGKVARLNRREAGDVISILKWLADRSERARAYMARTRDYAGAARLFQWPDVTLPESVPALEEEMEKVRKSAKSA